MIKNLPANKTDFILYTSSSGYIKADVFLKDETVWLTQKSMAVLFGVRVPGINKHLKTYLVPVNWMKIQLFPFWK